MADQILEIKDQIDPARANALMATLGIGRKFQPHDPLPPFAHQLYFWDAQQPENLGRDGHPRIGDFIPDLGFPRRMWAGGRLQFHAKFLADVPAAKTSRIINAERKAGRNGPMAIVKVEHKVHQAGQCVITEIQDLVYLPDDFQRPTPRQAHADAAETRSINCSPTLLFRYSALTFNGHRIHYDRDYARDIEGYAGLVTHGPLLAQMLMLWASEKAPLRGFEFRAMAPLMDFETATLCRDGPDYWITGPDRRLVMQATAGH